MLVPLYLRSTERIARRQRPVVPRSPKEKKNVRDPSSHLQSYPLSCLPTPPFQIRNSKRTPGHHSSHSSHHRTTVVVTSHCVHTAQGASFLPGIKTSHLPLPRLTPFFLHTSSHPLPLFSPLLLFHPPSNSHHPVYLILFPDKHTAQRIFQDGSVSNPRFPPHGREP